MIKNQKISQSILIIVLLYAISFKVAAQSLLNVQQTSQRTPARLKIDGKATEWNNQYLAYNTATSVFYTIANNNDEVYLVIHATEPRVIEKMIEGGISFTISAADKNITILFPLLSMDKARGILVTAGKPLSDNINPAEVQPTKQEPEQQHANLMPGANRAIPMPTTGLAGANNDLMESLKEIKVSGISEITDTIKGVTPISRYYGDLPLHYHNFKIIEIDNKDGIKAMTQFDADGSYTYELAMPVKYLGASSKFSYAITLNARGEDERFGDIISYSNKVMLNQYLETPTSFGGEYVLAGK